MNNNTTNTNDDVVNNINDINVNEVLENQLKKALADYTNLERDIDRRIEMRSVQLKLEIAKQLMDILDASDLAIKSKENIDVSSEVSAWFDGVVVILSQVEKTLEVLGISKIEVNSDDEYDSTNHEALAMVDGGKKNTIAQLVSNGYRLGEYIVRPARVIVYKGNS